jgi:hypothetical protein
MSGGERAAMTALIFIGSVFFAESVPQTIGLFCLVMAVVLSIEIHGNRE